MSTICLNMIVKNESHIILETLDNLCQKINFDYWVISDTGSEDNTVELITDFFGKRNIKGEIHYHEWKNFSHNRNLALEACKGKSEYVFFFDADDLIDGTLVLPKELTKDAYYFKLTSENRDTDYKRKLLVKNNNNFYWRGVVHEFIGEKEKISEGFIEGDYFVISRRKGNRNTVSNKEKYLRDAELLSKAFLEKEDPDLLPRYAFYAAQSYHDAEELDLAVEWYLRRVNLKEGWADEKYVAYLRLGFISEHRNDLKKAIDYWTQAITVSPDRAEAWYHIARRYNWDKQYALAYTFSCQGESKSFPVGSRLFLQKSIYSYWLKYEVCINAYQCGNYLHSYKCFKKLLQYGTLDLIERVSHQIDKYIDFINDEKFSEIKHIRELLLNRGLSELANKYFGLGE